MASTGIPNLSDFSTVDLLEELRRRHSSLTSQLNNPSLGVLFVGAPGSGKGTQSNVFKSKYELCHLATGDILRDAVKSGTQIGMKAKAKLDAGELVDDKIVISLIEEQLDEPQCRKGFILDGFPRNITQAKALDTMLERKGKNLDGVLYFDIPDNDLVERVTGRRIHPPSGRVYHVKFNPPKIDGKDDITGEPLIHRSDDSEATLRRRLETYHRETVPILDYYSKFGIVRSIDATKSSAVVSMELDNAFKLYSQKQRI